MKKIAAVLFLLFAVPLTGADAPAAKPEASLIQDQLPKVHITCNDLGRFDKENLVGCQLHGVKPDQIIWVPEVAGVTPGNGGWFHYIPVSSLRPIKTRVYYIDPDDPKKQVMVIDIVGQRIGDAFACLSCLTFRQPAVKPPATPAQTVASKSP